MDPLSTAAVSLGTAVVKSACSLWCGDDVIAADAADTVADLLKDRLADAIEQRRIKRMFESFEDTVAKKVLEINAYRFKDLPSNEREATVLAVSETFATAPLSDSTLYTFDLDALYLERHLRESARDLSRRWGLSDQATGFYDLLLRESCTYVLEIYTTLPKFVAGAFAELLKRLTLIEGHVNDVLNRIPARETSEIEGDDGFAADYRRQVVRQLDRMELYGAPVSEASRGYPLSVAYISLNVSATHSTAAKPDDPPLPLEGFERRGAMIASSRAFGKAASRAESVPVTAMMMHSRRLFVRGEAGCGKTTLLRWLAVNAAHQSFPSELEAWNGLVPFFIPLRRFVHDSAFPSPEQFLDAIGRMISAQMPSGWVHRLMASGRALVLVDGVDELPEARRSAAQAWLRELVSAFPDSSYVVTSRPVAVAEQWLARSEFSACMIQPMAPSDIRQFIVHWHYAIRSMTPEQRDRDELELQEHDLQHSVAVRRDLRQLATNPLLCALLCALNRERRTKLPQGRIELYRVALEMLLQRRDNERQVAAGGIELALADKQELLQDLAYWYVRNGLTAAERDRVLTQLKERLRTRRMVTAPAPDVLATLLERSGVIREPEVGRIDFIHRTFQEFLAAQAVIAEDDTEMLIEHAADDQWRQVYVLAVGLGSVKQRSALIKALLEPPRRLRARRNVLDLVALACMETADDLTETQIREITDRSAHLLPPSLPEHVTALAAAGELALELIDTDKVGTSTRARYTAQLAALVGGEGGLSIIERLAQQPDLLLVDSLVALWEYFEPKDYARRILSGRTIRNLEISSTAMIGALHSLPGLTELACRFGEPWADFSFIAQLPSLTTVRIILPLGGTPVTIDAPPHLRRIAFTSRDASQEAVRVFDGEIENESPPAQRELQALAIVGLDAMRVLTHLKTTFIVDHLVIAGDDRLRDLRDLALPDTLTALTIRNCRNFVSLAGIDSATLPRLRALALENAHTVDIDVETLFVPASTGEPRRMLDQLSYIHVSGIAIADLVHRFGATTFDLRTTAGYRATWTQTLQ